ncbi:hypothetical protein N9L68_06160 [bacterium]|nr:hypothetical protein [bacterium]
MRPPRNKLLRVTNDSFYTKLSAHITQFERKPTSLQRMFDEQQIEFFAAQSSLLHNLILELKAHVPTYEKLAESLDTLVTAFVDGDANPSCNCRRFCPTTGNTYVTLTWMSLKRLRIRTKTRSLLLLRLRFGLL